jgi:hypothetical protein
VIREVSATDLWVLGQNDTTSAPLVWHGNGRTWTQISVPSRLLHGGAALVGITATSADNAWAVGVSGAGGTLILHWNGHAWSRQASPNLPKLTGGLSSITATSARDAWAVGDQCSMTSQACSPLILHWNGASWSKTKNPQVALPLNGGSTVLIHWNGKTWSHVPSPTAGVRGSTDLWQVAAISRQDAWAIGSYCAKPYTVTCSANRPLLQHWTGKRWITASI